MSRDNQVKERITIIAEAGVNHNGSEALAFKLIDAAFKAGADIVKFQTFKAKNLVTENAKQADYQVTKTKKELVSEDNNQKATLLPRF